MHVVLILRACAFAGLFGD